MARGTFQFCILINLNLNSQMWLGAIIQDKEAPEGGLFGYTVRCGPIVKSTHRLRENMAVASLLLDSEAPSALLDVPVFFVIGGTVFGKGQRLRAPRGRRCWRPLVRPGWASPTSAWLPFLVSRFTGRILTPLHSVPGPCPQLANGCPHSTHDPLCGPTL